MILTIAGADFSGANIGTNTSVGISYNGRVTGKPTSITKDTALTSTITINTGYTYDSITSVTVGGQSISEYTATDNGDGTVTLTIPANKITGRVVVTVSTTATSGGETGGDSEGPDTPSLPSSTVWYTDVTNTSLTTDCAVSNTSYGWSYSNSTDIDAIKNKPINAVKFVTTSQSGKVTIGVADSFQSTTIVKTLQKEFTKSTTSKEIVTVVFDEVITLTGDQRLVFEPSTYADRKYNHFFGTVSGHAGFYSRIPTDLDGKGNTWKDNAGNSIGISVGYVVSGGSDNGGSDSGDSNSGITWYTNYSSTSHSGTCSNDSGGWTYTNSDTEPIRNKPINYVKFATVSPSGSVRVGKASLNSETVTDIVTGSFTNNTGGATIVEVELSDTITLSDNEYIIFEPYTSPEYAFSSKEGKYSFKYMTSGGNGFLSRIPLDLEKNGETPWRNNVGMNIGWSVGYKQK